MSATVPKTAMVFAAGLGVRMRPITHSLPKPLVKVRGRALIDYCLDRLAENGVERAIVNVHWLADQIESQLAGRPSPKIMISDERSKLLDQGGGIRRALPAIGPIRSFSATPMPSGSRDPARISLASPGRSIPKAWTSCSWSRRAPARSGSTRPAIHHGREGRLGLVGRARSRPSSIPGWAS